MEDKKSKPAGIFEPDFYGHGLIKWFDKTPLEKVLIYTEPLPNETATETHDKQFAHWGIVASEIWPEGSLDLPKIGLTTLQLKKSWAGLDDWEIGILTTNIPWGAMDIQMRIDFIKQIEKRLKERNA